jgi:5-bromo-4-chloroindolyl phosphate hydrolysis protein
MIDFHTAQVWRHRRNIDRYCRLLATELTDVERQYLHTRITEEHAQLERLEKSQGEQRTNVVTVAEVLGKSTAGQSHI